MGDSHFLNARFADPVPCGDRFVLLVAILLSLIVTSASSIKQLGLSFLWGRVWDPVALEFKTLPFLVGTWPHLFWLC
jgi:hypothetical protein